jgi:hypothetical protein
LLWSLFITLKFAKLNNNTNKIGKEKIHIAQLSEIHEWIKRFKQKNCDSARESVLFDVICGDFNMETCHQVDIYINLFFSNCQIPF